MIQNNTTQVNNFFFDVVMPVLKSSDWHLLTLFLYRPKCTLSFLEEIMSDSGLTSLMASLKSLEDQGFIEREGDGFVLSLDDSKYKIKRKKAKQNKTAGLEFETIDIPTEDMLNWQSFLKSVPMAHHIREILWRVYEATGRDKNNPWRNIPNINDWLKEAKVAWDLAEQNMDVISKSILELTSKGFPIASPRSLHKTIMWVKPKLEKKDENVADVGGWLS